MIQIEITLNSDQDQTEQVLQEIKKYQIKGSILKIVYHIPDEKQDKVDLKVVQKACEDAIFIAGITPTRKIVGKEKRAVLRVDMDIDTLLKKYFESKGYSDAKKTSLLQKLHTLHSGLVKDAQISGGDAPLQNLI